MKTYLATAVLLIFAASISVAGPENPDESDPWVKTHFLIVASLRDYNEAKQFAIDASGKLGYKLDFRGLLPHGQSSLTWPRERCEKDDQMYPCYVARGRWDEGVYISIERSDAYQSFQSGYYIVVVASGQEMNDKFKKALTKSKKFYPDAYIKSDKVYMGCMH